MKALTLKARLVLFFAAFLSSGIMFAASGAPFKVTGQVTDESGETLIGVSVQTEGGKKIGQMTDIDGNYSITLDGPAELVFSYVGMEPVKVKVSGACVKNILMKASANVLDDVVVVGYGTQKKINLTGAVQNVTSDEILKRSVSNGANALQGIIPGLSAVQGSGAPGGDAASIKIRGLGSLNSSTSPLVLIDGVEGDMNRIDLNQVESISVLKDAASASIYGSRASNGVILVTTKRGAEGRVKVTFNGYVGWNKPTSLPKAVDAIGLMEAVDQANINNDQQPIYTDIIDIYRNEGPDYITYHDTNWRDAIIKSSAMVQNYSVGVSGGSENINVYASAGYYKQDGMVPNNQFQRTNLRLNSDMKINRFVKLGLDMSMRQAESISPIGGSNTLIGYALTFQPIWSGINADGTWGYGLQGNNPIATINDGMHLFAEYLDSIGQKYEMQVLDSQGDSAKEVDNMRQFAAKANGNAIAYSDPNEDAIAYSLAEAMAESGGYLGTVGVYEFEDVAQLEHNGDGFFTGEGAQAVQTPYVLWKYLERSNADMIQQMTEMLTCQRTLQSAAQTTKMYDQLMSKMVILGSAT